MSFATSRNPITRESYPGPAVKPVMALFDGSEKLLLPLVMSWKGGSAILLAAPSA